MSQINLDPKIKAWVQLIAIVVGTGAGITATTIIGGCNKWVAVLVGLGAAGAQVGHALADSPNDK